MNRLFRVLHRWKCKNAAQKLALDALRHLGDDRRAGVFLWHVESYLRGVDAPEAEFRDFTNHVLYPVENWGGAARVARKWYWKTVETLRTRDWNEAAYAAGAMTRYVAFAFSPPRAGHDGQTLALRRPIEWCVSRLYDDLTASSAEETKPIRIQEGDDWLERLVTTAAEDAYCHLRTVTTKFDFDAVAARPAGLDDELRRLFALQLSQAAATAGAILGRAIDEAGAEPPRYWLGPAGLLALPSLPLFWLTQSRVQAVERRLVRAMHREFASTGRIEGTLPEDARAVRDAYELEVLKKTPRKNDAGSSKPTPPARSASEGRNDKSKSHAPRSTPTIKAPIAGKVGGTPQPLARTSPLDAAPSIDGKLVPLLQAAGIKTIGDLLAAGSDDLASALHPHATPADVTSWQDQARLACAIPSLTPAETQLLVACGVTGPEDLAALSPVELWELVVPVAESPDGRRLLRGEPPPDLEAVTQWIDAAKRLRKAA